jgi:hypothetical protein
VGIVCPRCGSEADVDAVELRLMTTPDPDTER